MKNIKKRRKHSFAQHLEKREQNVYKTNIAVRYLLL